MLRNVQLILWNKKDKHQGLKAKLNWQDHHVYPVSSYAASDVTLVLNLIADRIVQPTSDAFYARQRHLDLLRNIMILSEKILANAQCGFDIVLVAEAMREIQLELDKLVGLFSTEDLLGEIFGSFCIGK